MRKNKAVKKQLWKYATYLVVGLLGLSGLRLFIGLSQTVMIYVLSTTIVLFLIMLIFDLVTWNDLIPIIKR